MNGKVFLSICAAQPCAAPDSLRYAPAAGELEH
jgi:hypothetical protein